jgi:hypothetical protein
MATPTITTLSGNVLSIDLGTRDFEGFRNDALELADSVASDWTDRSEADVGVTLVESQAFMMDNLSYYQDRCANECLWPCITQRRSIIQQGKQIGYELSPNVSAQVELTFVTSDAGTVPEKTQVEVDTSDGSDPAIFELESDFVATGAGTTTGVIALHGTSVSETIGSSDGGAAQTFVLSSTPLATNPSGTSSLEVYVTEGGPATLWTEVDTFHLSEASDTHYRVEIDEFDVVTVIFGDGVNGKIPAAGTNNITADYRIGGGASGNEVGQDKLTKLIGNFTFVTSVTNPDQPSGGDDKETIAHAIEQGPAELVAMDRAVTHDDYETLAKSVSGVSQAKSYQGDGAFEEKVIIVATGTNPVPTGSWDSYTEVGSGLLGSVGSYLNERKTTPVILLIEPCQLFEFYIDIQVFLFSSVRQSDVQRLIEDALEENFNANDLLLGEQIPMSKVYDVVEDVTGVDYLDLNRFQRQPYARLLSTGASSDLTFTSITVGEDTPRDRWNIRFTTTTTFVVDGTESSGVQVNTGTVGTPYTTDDGSFTFTATAGAISPSVDNQWEILTGPYLGNMDPDDDEIGTLYGDTFVMTITGGQGD